MNEILKTIANRFSCRGFADREVGDENLQAIVDAGLLRLKKRRLKARSLLTLGLLFRIFVWRQRL